MGLFNSLTSVLVEEYWHPVAFRQELAEKNSWLTIQIAEVEICLFNDEGDLRAFFNSCPHRGAKLLVGDTGQSKVRCQYHGWGYRNGNVIFPPSKISPKCDVSSLKLKTLDIELCGDLIFIAINPSFTLRNQLTDDVYDRLINLSKRVECRSDFSRYNFECAYPIAIENALEPYHIPFVHQKTLAKLKLDVGENTFHGENSIWRASVRSKDLKSKLEKATKLFVDGDFFPGYESIFIFPFSMISGTFGLSYSMQNFFPANNPKVTFFTSRLYQSRTHNSRLAGAVTLLMTSTASTNRKVFEEDHEICKLVPLSSWSTQPPTVYSPEEEKLLHYRACCNAIVSNRGSVN